MKHNSEFLGATAEDVVTGFKGVITGHVSYLTGCDQVLLVGKSSGNNEAPALWYDINRVEIKSKKPRLIIDTEVNAGPDKPAPVK